MNFNFNFDPALVLICLTLIACLTLGYLLGRVDLNARRYTLEELKSEAERARRYASAVNDLETWCGYSSRHVRLIANHLRAMGEGYGCNAGTPVSDEACNVIGLREQLRRLDQKPPPPNGRVVAEADGG